MAKNDAVVALEVELFGEAHAAVARLVVVRGDEEHVLLGHVADDVLHRVVVAGMSVLDAVPDWGLKAILGGEGPLLIHIGATDQLDAEVEAEGGAGAHFHGDEGPHALQVALIAVHNDHLVLLVELVCHLLAKRLNCSLNERLLGVDIKLAIAVRRDLTQLVDTLGELVEVGEVSGGEVA